MKKNKQENINYTKLRPDVLADLIAQRQIECNDTKADAIRKLKLDDEGTYIRPTYVEKWGKTEYLIGIDINNHSELVVISTHLPSGKVKRADMVYNHRIHFISTTNPNELNIKL